MKYVIAIGAMNVDYQFRVHRYPRDGETLLASEYWKTPGGKGANQAGAAASCGAPVVMVGAVGPDADGDFLLRELEARGVDCRFVQRVPGAATALSFIAIDRRGHNIIITYSDATQRFALSETEEPGPVLASFLRSRCGALLAHAEIPRPALDFVLRHARDAEAPVFLTPAPTDRVDAALLSATDVLLANAAEVYALSGVPTNTPPDCMRAVAKLFENRNLRAVIMTIGADGALLYTRDQGRLRVEHAPGFRVPVVDTTGCGDAFAGTLAARVLHELSQGQSLVPALRASLAYANAAGALTATRRGALAALPTLDEITALVKEHPQWALAEVTSAV